MESPTCIKIVRELIVSCGEVYFRGYDRKYGGDYLSTHWIKKEPTTKAGSMI